MLQNHVSPLWGVRSGSDTFYRLIDEESWDAICLHASYVTDHQSPEFPVEYAVTQNTRGMDFFVPLLKNKQTPIIWTGTYYEANEGEGSNPRVDISPYARSKRLSWERLNKLARKSGVPVGKFVMPNPFGPWEGKGLTHYLIRSWLREDTPTINKPDSVLDNCPVDLLAFEYTKYVEMNHEVLKPSILKPSFYVMSTYEFACRLKDAFKRCSNSGVALLSLKPADSEITFSRFNETKILDLNAWSENDFWMNYMGWAFKNM